ncbi:MAG: nucleotidyltransferase domain-containing protein [Gammaproteobacteria bacterium]|nr:nucleotidyltransferase domain-containing protein [Gammaproteobacteria bacterium]
MKGFLNSESTAAAAGALSAWPEAHAAVLYGSRARGDFSPESDFDIAFITQNGNDFGHPPLAAAGAIQALWRDAKCIFISEQFIVKSGSQVGSIARSIAREGLLLAGHWDRPALKEAAPMDTEEYEQLMHSALDCVLDAALAYGRIGSHPSLADDGRMCNRFVKNTANAAERTAKAILGRTGVDVPWTHSVEALVRNAHEAGRSDVANTIEPLNGDTQTDHVADYFVQGSDAHACRRAADRLGRVLDAWIQEWRIAAGIAVERRHRDMRTAALGMAAESANAVRQAQRRPNRDDDRPNDRERVDALLACGDHLANMFRSFAAALSKD